LPEDLDASMLLFSVASVASTDLVSGNSRVTMELVNDGERDPRRSVSKRVPEQLLNNLSLT